MTTSMTTLSGIDWNRCPAWIGISVRLRSESLSGIIGIRTHTSPLTWEHVGFSGDFLWDRAAVTADRRRTLNLGRLAAAA